MNGKYLYFAIAALFGVLSSLSHFIPFVFLTCIYLYLLNKYKGFTLSQSGFVICIFLTFMFTGHHVVAENKSTIPEPTKSFFLEFTDQIKMDGDLLQVQAFENRYKEKILVRYKIKSEEEKKSLKEARFYGSLCRVSGKLSKASIAKNPNAFNYQKYLAAKNIFWILETKEEPLQKCTPIKSTPLIMIKQLRFNGIHFLEKEFPSEIASLSAALIFGDRSLLDPDLLENYQKTGIVHLLAISGLHVSLLIGMVFYLGIRIGLTRQFMMNFLLCILPIYTILTGASPSVIRAALMIFIILLTLKWNKRVKLSPIDAISLTLMLYLFFEPMVILDAGFQLSFSVSLAILLSAPHILQMYQRNITRMLVTSVIAQLSALPILLYHFFEISFISIAANLLYIPLFSFVYLPGLYILMALHVIFGNTPDFIVVFFMKLISFSNGLIDHLAGYSFTRFIPGRPNLLFLTIYLLLIIAIFLKWEAQRNQKKKQHFIILLFVLFFFQNSINWLSPFGEVTMIDVGQGESILIRLPFRKGTYLIDTGGTIQFNDEEWKNRTKKYEVGRDVVVPFLKGKGITTIDKLILTHGDMDHIGGTFSVMNELEIKQLLMPDVAEQSQTEKNIILEAAKKRIQVVKVSEGAQWKSGKSLFYVLAPEKNYSGERNSGSIAIFAQVGGLNWFFGGDLDQEGEERVVKKYPHLPIDVLKAGHHGSKTSSSELFVDKFRPRVVMISVGERNRYGHPHQEVLARVQNTLIFRTDQQGAITYQFYQEKGTFSPFLHKIKQSAPLE